jgi:periplasmic copper chaperone A
MRALSLALVACLSAAPISASAKAADIRIVDGWARATPPAAPTGAIYFTVVNAGPADRLVGASTPAAERAEIHEMATTNMVMTMRQMKDGAVVPAKGSLTLAPGGVHVMLMRLKAPLKVGDTVPLTLRFQRAGEVKLTLPVKAAAAAPAAPHHHPK